MRGRLVRPTRFLSEPGQKGPDRFFRNTAPAFADSGLFRGLDGRNDNGENKLGSFFGSGTHDKGDDSWDHGLFLFAENVD